MQSHNDSESQWQWPVQQANQFHGQTKIPFHPWSQYSPHPAPVQSTLYTGCLQDCWKKQALFLPFLFPFHNAAPYEVSDNNTLYPTHKLAKTPSGIPVVLRTQLFEWNCHCTRYDRLFPSFVQLLICFQHRQTYSKQLYVCSFSGFFWFSYPDLM